MVQSQAGVGIRPRHESILPDNVKTATYAGTFPPVAAGMSHLLAPDRLLALYEDLFKQIQLAFRPAA